MKVIGTIFATYILVEGNQQCFLIDQHAAHERLVYERYKRMLENQAIITQQLLPPVVIEVTHAEHIIINESMDVFLSLGFDIESFGSRSFAIRGVPVILGTSNPREFLRNCSMVQKNLVKDLTISLEQMILFECHAKRL